MTESTIMNWRCVKLVTWRAGNGLEIFNASGEGRWGMHGQFLYLALIRGASQIVIEHFTDFSGYEVITCKWRPSRSVSRAHCDTVATTKCDAVVVRHDSCWTVQLESKIWGGEGFSCGRHVLSTQNHANICLCAQHSWRMTCQSSSASQRFRVPGSFLTNGLKLNDDIGGWSASPFHSR